MELNHADKPSEPGRRSLEVPVDIIDSYVLAGLLAVKIAELFGVSVRTVRRRMASHEVSILWFILLI